MSGSSYWSAHRRVRAERGPAAGQRCADCGGPAVVWCYDGDDPAERTDPRGRRYSLDPARFRPRCRFCQRRAVADRTAPFPPPRRAPELDAERAERLYRGGASSRGVAALMGVSRGVVLRALRARDVPIRPPVAPQRRPRRYPVTPRPQPRSDHQQRDDEPPAPTFHATPVMTTPHTSTTPISTSPTNNDQEQRQEQRQEQEQLPKHQIEPQSQYGPTHPRSPGGGREPYGPAAPGTQDPHEDRPKGE